MRSKPQNARTNEWLAKLVDLAKSLDSIFACGGELDVAAPLRLRGPKGKKLEIVEWAELRRTKIDKKLRAWCAPASFGDGAETRTDATVRNGRQLYARDGALAVEGFDEGLREILCHVRESLCPQDASPPIAELHSLNVYERGGHFVAHKDTPVAPGVFGTLVVCLPVSFHGGVLVIEQESRATFDWQTWGYSGRSMEEAGRRIRWAAFFGDVDHRIETVTSGCRATLTYQLRREADAPAAVAPPGQAESAFSAALVEALADPRFVPVGGKLGIPCLHLYSVPSGEVPQPESIRADLKGRDRLVVSALERAGLTPRVVPYVFETCGGENWRLHRDANAGERRIFAQKRLTAFKVMDKLPIEFFADWDEPDDVMWLIRPPWISAYPQPADGRPEPAVELLGETEYSSTGYFGNEASDSSFYSAAVILFDVPPEAARKPRSAKKSAGSGKQLPRRKTARKAR